MLDEQLDKIQEEIDPRYGEVLMYWTMDEFHRHERSNLWYVLFLVVGLALILYAILTANYVFAVFLVLAGTFMILQHFRDPDNVPVLILSTGLAVGNHYHPWEEVKDFWVAYDPPNVSKLYVDFQKIREPYVSIDLPEDMDPNEIRDVMLLFVDESTDRKEESLTDYVRRLYKL